MKAQITGLVGALAAGAVLGGCAEDPLGDLDASPAAIVADASVLALPTGESQAVTASVVDGRLTPLKVSVTFTACDANVTVQPDASYDPVPRTSARAIVTGVSADVSCVVLAGGGLSDTIPAAVLPLLFNGTLNPTSPQVGQVLTVTAAAPIAFGAADIDFGDGIRGEISSQNATTLTVIVPQPDADQPSPIVFEDLNVTGIAGLQVSLATAPLNIVNPYEPNDLPGTTPFTVPIPGVFHDGFKSSTCTNGVGDFCDNFYTVTLTGTTTFTATLEWDTEADLDILWCNADCDAFVGNFAGATGANPEVSQVTLNAGTYHLWINAFDNAGEPAHIYKVSITTP